MFALLTVGLLSAAEPVAPPQTRGPLQPSALRLLPLTSIKPSGWLQQQLRTQANGLSGHLDEFWPDVGPESAWLGGTGEGWERGPYYLDGLVPLAYLLNDKALIDKAQPWVEWTLTHQRQDGSIGPEKNKDWWPNMIMLKVLTQYQEATGDPRVIPFMQRYFAYQAANLASQPLKEWAVYRWQDEVVSILWLYNRTGDAQLLSLAKLLHQQGKDWRAQFANFAYKQKVAKPELTLDTHVVNNAMALKASGVWWQVTGDKSDRAAVYQQFRELDTYHLQPGGVHSGDEHYAGLNPTQGTELCAVVEGMFSLEHLISLFGDANFGDRLERIAYNALPGTFTGDMWAHQYDQQANQVLCNVHPRDWTNNKPDSNLFGLEPNFGCCTANLHQGWPKFVASLWMMTPDDGLAATVYGPNVLRTVVKGNVPIEINEETGYPFREKIRLTVSPERAVMFPLLLRIPAWVERAAITVNGQPVRGAKPGTFYRLLRTWKKGDIIELTFPMSVRTSHWFHNSLAVERGPLVYSLKIGTDWRKQTDREVAPDWEVYPTSAWNYALIVKNGKIVGDLNAAESTVGDFVFTPSGTPVELQLQARKVTSWRLENGSAGLLPPSPVKTQEPVETITLIPYGAAKLRITAFPWTGE